MTEPYHPIDCGAYDELEIFAMRRVVCDIEFRDVGFRDGDQERDGQTVESVQTRIVDVYARDGEELIRLENDQIIRLDRLILVNGKAVRSSCESKH